MTTQRKIRKPRKSAAVSCDAPADVTREQTTPPRDWRDAARERMFAYYDFKPN